MTLFLRIVGGLCLGVMALGLTAPGMVSRLTGLTEPDVPTMARNDQPDSDLTSAPEVADTLPESQADSAMIGALDSIVQQHQPILGPYGNQLQHDLLQTDGMLQSIKRGNRDAILQAGRRVRLPGRSPNVLLVLVPGLTVDQLSCYNETAPSTPGFDAIAARGTRLLQFQAAQDSSAPAWTCLLDGVSSPQSARAQSFVTVLWQGGYDTLYVGDASHLAGDPRDLRFDHWFGFRTASEAAARFPDVVWLDDRQLELKPSPTAEEDSEAVLKSSDQLLLEQSVGRLARMASRRPGFVLVSLPTEGWSSPELDAIPTRLMSLLERTGLATSTVVIISGAGDERENSPIPFLVGWPRPIDGGVVVSELTTWPDVAATICELAEISPRPMTLRGVSQRVRWQNPRSGARSAMD